MDLENLKEANPSGPVYHYTDVYDLARFLYAGTIDVWPDLDWPQRAWVAWFSKNPFWERGCALAFGRMHSVEGNANGVGRKFEYLTDAARIQIRADAAPYRWDR